MVKQELTFLKERAGSLKLFLISFLPMSKTLNLIELFASVQGETSFTGQMTTFIRLARCNLRCTWCDTTYSFGRGVAHTLDSIIEKVQGWGCRYVCITGGEPLLQPDVHLLMKQLCDLGYIVSLETSGSLITHEVDERVHVILDVKCPGSGMSEKNLLSNLNLLKEQDEVKFVICDRNDFDFAHEICKEYNLFKRSKEVLFSPVFNQLDTKDLVNWILQEKLPCRLNLQIHKFIWTPDTKGV